MKLRYETVYFSERPICVYIEQLYYYVYCIWRCFFTVNSRNVNNSAFNLMWYHTNIHFVNCRVRRGISCLAYNANSNAVILFIHLRMSSISDKRLTISYSQKVINKIEEKYNIISMIYLYISLIPTILTLLSTK